MSDIVLLLVAEDFANAGFGFYKSLQSVGVLAQGLKYHPHAFDYPEQLKLIEHSAELFGAVNNATKIMYLQGTRMCRDALPRNLKGVDLYLFVGDQSYRNFPERIIGYYPKIKKLFYQGSDLKGKSSYPEAWLLPAVDTDIIQTKQDVSHMSHNSLIKIAHFPRSPKAKGTHHILAVIDKLKSDSSIRDKFIFETSDGMVLAVMMKEKLEGQVW